MSPFIVLNFVMFKDVQAQVHCDRTKYGYLLCIAHPQILQMVANRVKWKVSTMIEGTVKDLLNDIIWKTPLSSAAAVDVKKIVMWP